jgi:glutathione S-transferase
MPLIFHERVGLEGRRISPFSWRIRYALAHKGIDPEVVPTRFADVARIRTLSGQDLVPIIEHDGEVVHDSWSIACHLEDHFPDRPSLFGGAVGRGAARLVNFWSDAVPCGVRSTLISSGASIRATARTSAVHARRNSG